MNREVILPKIHENLLEYIGRPKRIYTTEYIYTCLLEFITQDDTKIIREAMAHDDEQEYEASINYNTVDHTATIAIVNQMVKVRKLNRAIGETLKLLYNYCCQILWRKY